MQSILPTRPFTFRVEKIPPSTTAEELIHCFYTEDQPRIRVRSLVPAVDSYELDVRDYTATVSFQAATQTILSPRLLDEDVSIDSDFHGFTPLNHPQGPIAADVIAVTGLAGHAFGSWAHSAQNMWLRDYLPRDISNARVLIYGYPSQLHGNISRSILSDHSTNMIHRLLTMREMAKCQSRPIIFIGHSLGCLIIKKALCDINGSVGIYSSRLPVRSIIFMGAPHKGLETTALETLVKSQATEDMIRELKSESPTLTELNDKFRHVAKDIDILTCYELSPTKTALEMPDKTWKREGPPIMMVSLDSARQWYPREEFVACNADHTQIAKLKRGENSIYPSVRWAIQKALLSAGDLYSEAKGIHYGESRSLESAAVESTIRQSLLQVAHHRNSIPPYDRTADSAPTSSRHPSEDTIDQQIRRLEVHESADGGNTQSERNSFNKSIPQWSSSIDVSHCDDIQSSATPTRSVEVNEASILFDEDSATSRGIETTASEDIREDDNPDSARKYQMEDSNISTSGIRSMIMSDVMDAAITRGDEAKTRELLAHSYDVNCRNGDGMTPLLLAARYEHENILRLLLKRGAHPRVQCNQGYTTLHWLARGTGITETLIDLLLGDRPPFEVADGKGITPLMSACVLGNLLLATRLIRHGADVRAKTSSGQTALCFAAYYGRAPMISLLVENGAELELKSYYGYTPLHVAAIGKSDSSETVEQLIRAGADKEATVPKELERPLHLAIRSGNEACVRCLLESGVDIEARDEWGWRPLHRATSLGRPQIVRTLLRHGTNVESSACNGWRPMHLAARYCQLETMKVLLDHGANPTAKTRKLLGKKPSEVPFYVDSLPDTRKQAVRALLKEAEKTWKESGMK